MLFCWIAFFGTGNVVSLSSFELSSTYRFAISLYPLPHLFLFPSILFVYSSSSPPPHHIFLSLSFTRFVTIFRPFLMTAILLFKIIIPFFLVAVAYGIVTQIRKSYFTFFPLFSFPFSSFFTSP